MSIKNLNLLELFKASRYDDDVTEDMLDDYFLGVYVKAAYPFLNSGVNHSNYDKSTSWMFMYRAYVKHRELLITVSEDFNCQEVVMYVEGDEADELTKTIRSTLHLGCFNGYMLIPVEEHFKRCYEKLQGRVKHNSIVSCDEIVRFINTHEDQLDSIKIKLSHNGYRDHTYTFDKIVKESEEDNDECGASIEFRTKCE